MSAINGMTLLDLFACHAMQGMLAASENYPNQELAMYAYDVANAMMAVRDQQKNGWIEWDGTECPVDPKTQVVVTYHDGSTDTGKAGEFLWEHKDGMLNITSYRVLES